MTTWKDIFLRVLLFIGYSASTIILFNANLFQKNLPYSFPVIILPFIVFLIIRQWLRNQKRIGDHLKRSFSNLNYTILSERPLTFAEQWENMEVTIGPYTNVAWLRALKYKNEMKRCFTVKNEKDHDFKLIVSIRQSWGDDIKYNIDSTSRIRE